MATPTYELIETTTLTSSASSVTFSSITQDYRDLVLVVEGIVSASSSGDTRIQINNDTGSNYNEVSMLGDGSSAFSSAGSNLNRIRITASNVSNGDKFLTITQFLDYSATDKHKSVLNRSNQVNDSVAALAARYASTSAITSIKVFFELGTINFATDSVISLYGIAS